MSSSKRYTVTAALPYTNGPIHIGHLAGVYVPADIYARYLRLTGNDVAYICGSDEHGVAIPMRAKKEGVSVEDFLNVNYSKFSKLSGLNYERELTNNARSQAENYKSFKRIFQGIEVGRGSINENWYLFVWYNIW